MCCVLNTAGHLCSGVFWGSWENTSLVPLGDKGLIKPFVTGFCNSTMQETVIANGFGMMCSCMVWFGSKSAIKTAEQRKAVLCAREICSL